MNANGNCCRKCLLKDFCVDLSWLKEILKWLNWVESFEERRMGDTGMGEKERDVCPFPDNSVVAFLDHLLSRFSFFPLVLDQSKSLSLTVSLWHDGTYCSDSAVTKVLENCSETSLVCFFSTKTPRTGRRDKLFSSIIRVRKTFWVFGWTGENWWQTWTFFFFRWHGVASWTWDAHDDACGICRLPFDGCCPDCKTPGDDCPLSECAFFSSSDLSMVNDLNGTFRSALFCS